MSYVECFIIKTSCTAFMILIMAYTTASIRSVTYYMGNVAITCSRYSTQYICMSRYNGKTWLIVSSLH